MSSSTINEGLGCITLESVRANALKSLKEEIGTLEKMPWTTSEFKAVVRSLQDFDKELGENPRVVETIKLAWAAKKLVRVLAEPNTAGQQLTASIADFESEIHTIGGYHRKESLKTFMQVMTKSMSVMINELRKPLDVVASENSDSSSESCSFKPSLRRMSR